MILQLDSDLWFPPVDLAEEDGFLAVGGDLSIERLLLAYSQGIFPWYEEDSPILWWSPPERAVLEPTKIHISHRLHRILRKGDFQLQWDHHFAEVIASCAETLRRDQEGTWITAEMKEAYIQLHQQGYAHSVEVYQQGALVGGLYGVSLGGIFFAESMFSIVSNASKIALVGLAQRLAAWDFDLVDCQVMNEHLQQFGVVLIPREEYLDRLNQSLRRETKKALWSESGI